MYGGLQELSTSVLNPGINELIWTLAMQSELASLDVSLRSFYPSESKNIKSRSGGCLSIKGCFPIASRSRKWLMNSELSTYLPTLALLGVSFMSTSFVLVAPESIWMAQTQRVLLPPPGHKGTLSTHRPPCFQPKGQAFFGLCQLSLFPFHDGHCPLFCMK